MYIKKMILKDFKTYENAEITFNNSFNVLIGENNIGKTTLFEALQLWKKCFDISIMSNGKDFYSDSVPLYISFEDLYFLRLTKDEDIFYGNKRTCEITVQYANEETNTSYLLGFKLTKPHITNAYIRVSKNSPTEFVSFKDMLDSLSIKLTEFLFIQQTSPVAKVLSKEPYMFKGQIIKKIEKGKSNEVLRNKILQSLNKSSNLESWMKNVLDMDFTFKTPTRTAREKEEYIDLYVEIGGKKLDVYLQGSGFLQAAEIFSTIDIMDNALNIMLIDEPDSHISPRIQNNLLKCLRQIANTQIFVITHNDNFVSDLEPENIIFINEENKNLGDIKPLTDVNIDTLHATLGGIITGLTRLQKSKRVVFVEGKDDIAYIKKLNDSLTQINSQYCIDFKTLSFWFIRGKDYIPQKVMTGKQLLSQAVDSCKFAAIFDKDFSTESANEAFVQNIKRRLGANAKVHTHDGYCIESVLFSNCDILKTFLQKLLSGVQIDLDTFISGFVNTKKNSIRSVGSELYLKMKDKFASQKTEARVELSSVDFDQYAAEAAVNIQYLMLKDNIKDFVISLESIIGKQLFSRDDDGNETIASRLLEEYFASITCDEELYPDYINMLNMLKNF